MAFNVNEIRSQLTLGGARPALFQVTIQNPVDATGDIKTPFMVEATNIPESAIGTVQVPYFGRKIKIAGDRTFNPWTVRVINDEDFLIRNAMETWMTSINSHEGNVTAFGSASPLLYKSQAQVIQYSKTGLPVRTYQFNGLYPSTVSPIGLDWNATDQLETFEVTFEYDWWEISGGVTGDAGGA